MIESSLNFFRGSISRQSSSKVSRRSRHRSTLTPCHYRLECLLTFSLVLVQERSLVQLCGGLFGYSDYGYGGYGPFEMGGSRPPGAPPSDDEDDGRHDDDEEEE